MKFLVPGACVILGLWTGAVTADDQPQHLVCAPQEIQRLLASGIHDCVETGLGHLVGEAGVDADIGHIVFGEHVSQLRQLQPMATARGDRKGASPRAGPTCRRAAGS